MKKALFLTLLLFITSTVSADTTPSVPDGLEGFRGKVKGKVVSTEDGGFVLEVTEVIEKLKGNKAKKSSNAVGKKLLINVQWEKEGNEWKENDLHVRYVSTLEEGKEISIEIKQEKKKRFHILELDEHQRYAAREKGRSNKKWDDSAPFEVKGFQGTLAGMVHKTMKNAIVFEVSEVKTTEGNKSYDAENLKGKKVTVRTAYKETWKDSGKWVPIREQANFMRSLEKGQKLALSVRNNSKHYLDISELTGEQKAAAKKQVEVEEKAALPEGGYGFKGVVNGKVIEVERGRIYIKVKKVVELYDDNRSENSKKLVGETMKIKLKYHKDDSGKWRPIWQHRVLAELLEDDGGSFDFKVKQHGKEMHLIGLTEKQEKAIKKAAEEWKKEKREEREEREKERR